MFPSPTSLMRERERLAEQERIVRANYEEERREAEEWARRKEGSRPEVLASLRSSEDLVQRFLRLAEQRVSVTNDWGEENIAALPETIKECIVRIGQQTGVTTDDFSPHHEVLYEELHARFQSYHSDLARFPAELNRIDEMTGVEFEGYLAQLLRLLGATDVMHTPASGDQGADLLVTLRERRVAVQVKRHSHPVGNSSVQEAVAAVKFYDCDVAWVVTNSTFTPAARELAEKNEVELLDRAELKRLIATATGTGPALEHEGLP